MGDYAQAAYILVNIATGSDAHRRAILNRPNLVDALLYFTVSAFETRCDGALCSSGTEWITPDARSQNHPRADVRQAGVWGALNLTFRHSTSERRRQTPGECAIIPDYSHNGFPVVDLLL